MEANENNLQDLRQNNKAPQKGTQKGFFSWLRVHIFDWWMRLLILFLLMVGIVVTGCLAIVFERPDYAFLILLSGIVLLLVTLGNIIFCIIDLFKKRFGGLIGLLLTFFLAWMIFCVDATILLALADAERWEPENGFEKESEVLEITEPLNTNVFLYKDSDPEKISEDSLQN
ncbi:MAG: hypothetical protein IKQ24_00370 [Verrucomicrobia bacterium]|nr:hypothetical protein [Verrucomicrobiota bacterium]